MPVRSSEANATLQLLMLMLMMLLLYHCDARPCRSASAASNVLLHTLQTLDDVATSNTATAQQDQVPKYSR